MPFVDVVSRVTPVHTALRNCTRDEGRSFEVGNQVLISSHRKLLCKSDKNPKGMIERGDAWANWVICAAGRARPGEELLGGGFG